MAVRNHLIVTAVDFLGFRSRHEMTVIATDDAEMREEIERFFWLRDVTDSWEITEVIERRELAESDPHAVRYRDGGAHSYH